MHNGVKYVHTNSVVLWAGRCQRNRVKVMIRFEDNPKTLICPTLKTLECIKTPTLAP